MHISGKARRVAAHHGGPQFLRHLCLADVIVAQRHRVRRFFITIGILLLRGGAHGERATLDNNHFEPDAIDGVLPIMLAIVRTGIRRSTTQLAAGRTLGMTASICAIFLQLTASGTLGMTAIIGTGIRRSTTQLAAGRTLGMVASKCAILFQLTTSVALGMLAAVGAGVHLRTTKLAAGLALGMIAAIRAQGLLLVALPAHRLLCAQA